MNSNQQFLACEYLDSWLRSQIKFGPYGRMAQFANPHCETCQENFSEMMEEIRAKLEEFLKSVGVEVEEKSA